MVKSSEVSERLALCGCRVWRPLAHGWERSGAKQSGCLHMSAAGSRTPTKFTAAGAHAGVVAIRRRKQPHPLLLLQALDVVIIYCWWARA